MAITDPRRSALEIYRTSSPLDILLINPESTYADVTPSPVALTSAVSELSSPLGGDLFGDQDHEPNHGILQLATLLTAQDYAVDVLDLNSALYLSRSGSISKLSTDELFVTVLRQRKPKVIGFSAMTPNLRLALRYSHIARKECPSVPQILGGLAAEARNTMFDDSELDVIYRGQAETNASEIFRNLLAFGRPAKRPVRVNAPLGESQEPFRTAESAQSRNPPPRQAFAPMYELLPRELPLIPRVFMSRGCAAGCSFCSPAAALDYRVAVREIDDVAEEIARLHATFSFDFWLLGDLTLFLTAYKVRQLIEQRLTRMSVRPWWCQTQVVLTSKDAFESLRAANCVQVAIGFEDFTTPEPAVARKHGSFERSVNACRQAKEAGLLTQSYWMFGMPEDSVAASIRRIQQMCWFAANRLMDTFHISFLVPYPGTRYFDNASDFGLSIDFHRYHEFIGSEGGYYNCLPLHSTRELSAEQIFVLTRLAIASVANEYYRIRFGLSAE